MCHPSEVEPASGISSSTFSFTLYTFHLSFLSLLWITYRNCPLGQLVQLCLCCQNRASLTLAPLLPFGFVCLSEWLRRSHGEVTRGPAGQLVLIASRGLFSGGRLVSQAAQMWGKQGISPQETSKLRPTGETDGRHRHIQAILIRNSLFFFSLYIHIQIQIHTYWRHKCIHTATNSSQKQRLNGCSPEK